MGQPFERKTLVILAVALLRLPTAHPQRVIMGNNTIGQVQSLGTQSTGFLALDNCLAKPQNCLLAELVELDPGSHNSPTTQGMITI